MDIVRRLKQEFSGTALEDVADQVRVYVKERHEAADEIERLRENAKQDAKYLLAYHRICQKHGIAPSSSELIEAIKENE